MFRHYCVILRGLVVSTLLSYIRVSVSSAVSGIMFPTTASTHLCMSAKLHQGHATGSRDIQNGWILSREPFYL